MSNDINLLHTTRPRVSPVLLRRVQIFRTIAIGFLFVIVVASTTLFILTMFSPLTKLEEDEQLLLSEFNSGTLRKKTDSYFLTKVRAQDIAKLLSNRSTMMHSYLFLTGLTNDSLTLSNLVITRDHITFSAASRSLQSIEIAISEVSKMQGKNKEIQSLTISDISFNPADGTYLFTVEVLLKKL